MRHTCITIGFIRYVIERNSANMYSLYLHTDSGCTYIGSWDKEDFEQAAARVYQRNSGCPELHYYGGV